MPGIVFAAMQSDRESLFPQFSHCLIPFRVLDIHTRSVNSIEQTYCSQLHNCFDGTWYLSLSAATGETWAC